MVQSVTIRQLRSAQGLELFGIVAQPLTVDGATCPAAALPGGVGVSDTQIGVVAELLLSQGAARAALELAVNMLRFQLEKNKILITIRPTR
jgi:hypothetical protein